jgi:uncharacterized protein (TIGR00255 family)|tara:strand:+ start:3270 stop:4115 length:846 start_codon:yes stop_codon:yes gene_type:complete
MIVSMTGYGKGQSQDGDQSITVEIRSLNSKGLDLSLRLPATYRDREMAWRKRVAAAAERGKVEVNIHRRQESASHTGLDADWLQSSMQALQSIGGDISNEAALSMALKLTKPQQAEALSDSEWAAAEQAIDEALVNFHQFRQREGEAMADDLRVHVAAIQADLDQVDTYESARIERVKERLTKHLEEAALNVNQDRFEQELIYYLEKFDINEEKVRLQAHLTHFLDTLKDGSGRKLGFLAQEIGREVNTLGSKANHADLQSLVVSMKESLEKIKEQSLNVR